MDKRYHIHVCYASGDLAAERSVLMQQLATNCFFTWSLQDANAVNNNYSRQQIDACDYVLFLVGSKYGLLAASGVSYLHLDFIYATSKLKPMAALLLENPEEASQVDTLKKQNEHIFNQRKLKDFRSNLINACQNFSEFVSTDDFSNKLSQLFVNLTQLHPTDGWVRNEMSAVKEKINKKIENTDEFMAVGIEKTQLRETIKFTYRTQAFKGGNFKEVFLSKEMTWGGLLALTADSVRMPASEDVLAKAIHEYLDSIALEEVKNKMPEVHAAARCQLKPKDLQTITLQFIANDWITVTDVNNKGKKQIILTPQGARNLTQWRSVIERNKIFDDTSAQQSAASIFNKSRLF